MKAKKHTLMEALSAISRDAVEEKELAEACKELVKYVSDSERDEKAAAASAVTYILSQVEDDLAKRICKHLSNQLDTNSGVLPILADIATQSEKLRGFLISSGLSYIDSSDSSLEDVKYIIEIYYHVVVQVDDIIDNLSDLLDSAKKFWFDEEMMCGLVTLLRHALAVSNDDQTFDLCEGEVLGTVLVLSGLLFTRNPSAMGLYQTFDFPRNSESSKLSLSHNLLVAVHKATDVLEYHDDRSMMIRPLIPIMSYILKFISENYMNNIVPSEIQSTLRICIDLETDFVGHKNVSYKKDLKLILNSKIPEWLLTIYEKSLLKRCCDNGSGLEGPCLPLDKCYLFQAVSVLVHVFADYEVIDSFTIDEKIQLFMMWRRFLDDKRTLEDSEVNLDFAFTFISSVFESSNFSTGYRQFLYDPRKSPVPSLIQLVARNTDLIGIFCLVVLGAFRHQEIVLKDTFSLFSSLPDAILNYLLKNNDLSRGDRKTMDSMLKSSSRFSTEVRMKSLAPKIAFMVLQQLLSTCTIVQLQELETRYGITDPILRLIKKSTDTVSILYYVELLNDLVDKQQLNSFSVKELAGIVKMVWGKVKTSAQISDHAVISLTYNVSMLLTGTFELDYSDFIPALLADLNNIHRVKPPNPGMLKIIWQLAKRRNHKQLFKKLVSLSCPGSVEYASQGKREHAQIFRLISDLIIENLEHDPPFNGKYLQGLTKCMVSMAQSSTLDEELYVLEDLVSPAIWLLEKESDEKIIANVKEFISILH